MIDVRALLDYLGDLENESDEEIIRRLEQAKADSANAWILDEGCWVKQE